MATIEQRGPKQWRVKIRKTGYPPLSETFERKSDALRWVRQVESDMDRGIFVSGVAAKRVTVADALDRYQREILPLKRSQKPECSRIRTLNEKLGSYSLSNLTSTVLAKYREDRLSTVKAQTVIHELALLRRVLKIATAEWGVGLPAGLPMFSVQFPKRPPGRDRRLSQQELDILVAALPAPHNRLSLFAIETAMRRGELAGMQWSHVDFQSSVLTVPITKTGRPRRIGLSLKAKAILKEQLGASLINPEAPGTLVWNLQPDSMTQALSRACVKVGIQDFRFHDLRHEATSRMVEKGLTILEVSLMTGHQSMDMLKRYTQLRPEDIAKKLG